MFLIDQKNIPIDGQRRFTLKRIGNQKIFAIAFKVPEGLHDDMDSLDIFAELLATGKVRVSKVSHFQNLCLLFAFFRFSKFFFLPRLFYDILDKSTLQSSY